MDPGAPVHASGVTDPRERRKQQALYTDIHSHVIWGVDDGAEEREETYRMLQEAAADGIRRIICTPHVTPGVYEFPAETFEQHFAAAEEYIAQENLQIELYRGAEILYTDNTPRLLREKKVATLAGTNCALVEFSPSDSRDHITDALQKVSGAGFIPVIAHMERYPAIGKIQQVVELKKRYGALVQINARSLTRKQPLLRRGFFDSLFKEGLVDFIATDTHAFAGRGTCMTEGMEALKKKFGEEAERRIRENPDRFLTK